MSELLKIFEFTAEQAKAFTAEQSVTGEPILINDVTIIPVSKLSCGFAGGGSDLAAKKKSDGLMGGSGMKVTKTPLSFLAVCGSDVQILHVAEEEMNKKSIIDTLSPLIDQLKEKMAEKKAAKGAAKETEALTK